MAYVLAVVLVGSMALAGSAAAKHGTKETKEYTAGAAPFLWYPYGCPGSPNVDGVEFCNIDDPEPSDVMVTIDDATGLSVPAVVAFYDENVNIVGIEPICGSETIPVPNGASRMTVDLNPVIPAVNVVAFGHDPCPAMATTGTVTAAWGS